ncbi:biotin--protein ligase [Aplochiton taeniatus]
MLITLCYVYLWVRFQKCYTVVIRNTLHRLCGTKGLNKNSFTFCAFNSQRNPPLTGQQTSLQSFNKEQRSPPLAEEAVFLKLGDKAIYITEPQACDDLSKWTLLWGSSVVCGPRIENISFIIEATSGHKVGHQSAPTSNKKKVLKWSDYCLPLACCPGQPFKAVAQASVDNFSRLGVAFMEDRLQLDNELVPSKIVSVLLQESALKELLAKTQPENNKNLIPLSLVNTQTEIVLSEPSPCDWLKEKADAQLKQCRKANLLLPPEIQRALGQRRGSEPLQGTQDPASASKEEDRSLGNHHHMEGHHGHHLHLSSCHECLEMENSTILSVKYASAENIPDLPDDCSTAVGSGAESSDELEDDAEGSAGRGRRADGKPPNVLVYTGGCQERFQAMRRLLGECIDMDSYVVYPLRPQQALSEPWLESAALLVLAEEEPLTPQLQARVLAYLGQGGRVLGLSSALCPAGLALEVRERRRGQVCRLNFTREDTTEVELRVLASGSVFVRDVRGGGEVELWGELKGDVAEGQKDMVIVRVTHGEDGGEAVLCQVHLETSPDSKDVTSEGFDELKMNNALRYEVLTEILTSLGLSCELSQAPPPTPVYILATSPEYQGSFLKWLHGKVDQDGLLVSSKTSFRVLSNAQLQDAPRPPPPSPPPSERPFTTLVKDPPETQTWDQFSLQAYSEHLRTRTLGRVLLYTEVVSTTMDLLEGLMLQLPAEMGLIAVASRQTQGRGRGGNSWLSPLGCAMFTTQLQVPVSSRLGQGIPFLQHLAALAMVEAVRTLPGYQDIDLRVKWPNDIYYSSQMKLGGVLVNSTVMGSTFHLLIGCGINVSNSNPTICVNDLVARHNRERGSSLEALTTAQLIGRSLTSLEGLIDAFQQGGPQAVLPVYYKRWIHGGTKVRLWSEDGPEAEVVGLDDNGFLQVHSKDQGVVTVQPDGNSFDMLRNLVVTKQR